MTGLPEAVESRAALQSLTRLQRNLIRGYSIPGWQKQVLTAVVAHAATPRLLKPVTDCDVLRLANAAPGSDALPLRVRRDNLRGRGMSGWPTLAARLLLPHAAALGSFAELSHFIGALELKRAYIARAVAEAAAAPLEPYHPPVSPSTVDESLFPSRPVGWSYVATWTGGE